MQAESRRREKARKQYSGYDYSGEHARRGAKTPLQRHSERRALSHMRLLGMDPEAPLRLLEVKVAFKKQAMLWHPDRLPHGDPERIRYEARFKEISEAYEYLTPRADAR